MYVLINTTLIKKKANHGNKIVFLFKKTYVKGSLGLLSMCPVLTSLSFTFPNFLSANRCTSIKKLLNLSDLNFIPTAQIYLLNDHTTFTIYTAPVYLLDLSYCTITLTFVNIFTSCEVIQHTNIEIFFRQKQIYTWGSTP
jgi:hypothetical protein